MNPPTSSSLIMARIDSAFVSPALMSKSNPQRQQMLQMRFDVRVVSLTASR